MSARAAWRLETLGFGEVYEYAPGKADWLAAGLPTEGTATERPRLDAALREAPAVLLGARVAEAAARARAAGVEVCFVTNEQGIVLGRLNAPQLAGDGDATVETVMRPGPVTYRPDADPAPVFHVLDQRGIAAVPVTDPDGRLLGVVRTADLAGVHAHRPAGAAPDGGGQGAA